MRLRIWIFSSYGRKKGGGGIMEKEIVCVVLSSDNKLEKVGVINPESGDKKNYQER